MSLLYSLFSRPGGALHAWRAGNAAGTGHIGGAGDAWGTVEDAGDTVSMLLVQRWKSTVWWVVGE